MLTGVPVETSIGQERVEPVQAKLPIVTVPVEGLVCGGSLAMVGGATNTRNRPSFAGTKLADNNNNPHPLPATLVH